MNNNNHIEEKKYEEQTLYVEPRLEEKLSELEILRQSLEEQKKKTGEYSDKILRLQADFDNYRKRIEKDKADFVKFSNEGIMLKLLSLFDDLERAKKAVKNSFDIKTVTSGIDLIYKNITATKIDRIEDVTYSVSGVLASFLNYGNVLIQTAGAGIEMKPQQTAPFMEIFNTPHPAKVTKLINELIMEEEQEKIEGRVR